MNDLKEFKKGSLKYKLPTAVKYPKDPTPASMVKPADRPANY